MASVDPGLAVLGRPDEDATKGAITDRDGLPDDQPVALDQFDERFETTKQEIWAYYTYGERKRP